MAILSDFAYKRLVGQWGAYDFRVIRDKHFVTASDLVENFIAVYQVRWATSEDSFDMELTGSLQEVRSFVEKWAPKKILKIQQSSENEVVINDIMFKRLHYGQGRIISFGSKGMNWKSKSEISEELKRYPPWSVLHAAAFYGGVDILYKLIWDIVATSKSPSEIFFFKTWWNLTDELNRPMLFPQVSGHTSGKFWTHDSGSTRPLHFDFGFVNYQTKSKILVECDSKSYHSNDERYQADRSRQNIAEKEGWSVRRFTYDDIMTRITSCFNNLYPDIGPF